MEPRAGREHRRSRPALDRSERRRVLSRRTHDTSVGTALEVDALAEAGIERADAFIAATDGDNTNILIGQVAQKRFDIGCVVVRILDPARADFYSERGLRVVCPTKTAIDTLMEAVRSCAIPPAKVAG